MATSAVRRLSPAVVAFLLGACVAGTSSAQSTDPKRPDESSPSVSVPAATDPPPLVPSADPLSAEAFWVGVAPGGMNAEHYSSLESMARASDLVAVGSVAAVSQDPRRHTSLSEDDGAFGQVDVVIEDVVIGTVESEVAGGPIHLEFFVIDPALLPRFEAGGPRGRVLLFLRNKAVEAKANGWPIEGPDTGHLYYRVVSEQGVIRDVNGRAEMPDDEGGFQSAVNKLAFDAVVEAVRAATP